MQYHPVAIIFCRPDKRSAIKLRVTHQSLMPGIFRHFLYDFYSPGHHLRDHRNRRINPVETPSHHRHPETAEIKKASRYYLLAGDFRLSPTPILSHT
ncbi:hypothetical protein, partial [Salmonella enterica]